MKCEICLREFDIPSYTDGWGTTCSRKCSDQLNEIGKRLHRQFMSQNQRVFDIAKTAQELFRLLWKE